MNDLRRRPLPSPANDMIDSSEGLAKPKGKALKGRSGTLKDFETAGSLTLQVLLRS